MEFSHTPVMPDQCIDYLAVRPGGTYVDGTVGGGGHARLICEKLSPEGTIICIDRDEDAIEAARGRLEKYDCRKIFVRSNYSEIKGILDERGIEKIDGALLDLGVSSFQLDSAERGFSYMHDAPLDMRMDRRDHFTAYDLVNTYREEDLTEVIKKYGEERWASRISRFICERRKEKPIETTGELVDIIKAAVPASARREGPHPAKRTFQAIRIEVNDELGRLGSALTDFLDVLAPGGRMCVITFHSLEDRIVKNVFRDRADPCTCPPDFPVCVCGKKADIKKITGKPVVPGKDEIESNPRARSAKLRVVERI